MFPRIICTQPRFPPDQADTIRPERHIFKIGRVVEAAALYPDRVELKREYPELEDDDTRQALEYAAESLDDQIITLGAA